VPLLDTAFGRVDGIIHLYGLGVQSGNGAALLQLERQVDRCAAAAAIHRACESVGLKTRVLAGDGPRRERLDVRCRTTRSERG
jgi:hypothetical protein